MAGIAIRVDKLSRLAEAGIDAIDTLLGPWQVQIEDIQELVSFCALIEAEEIGCSDSYQLKISLIFSEFYIDYFERANRCRLEHLESL